MNPIELHEEVEIEIAKTVIVNMLVNDAAFMAKLREAELVHTRRLGNRMGRWAQKEPHPLTVQPNTEQRIW